MFETLAYFDGVNFAAYNHYAGEKDIEVYPYNAHEGGESAQAMERIAKARKTLG